jgi:PKD repeat protein
LWDFGDGTTSSSEDPDHTFYSPGTYEVRLTVRDYFGQESEWTESITVWPEAKVYPQTVAFFRYRGLSSGKFDDNPHDDVEQVRFNLGWNDSDWKCGIVGIRAQGDIPDPTKAGGIHYDIEHLNVYMDVDALGNWWINASLETEGSQDQSWDIDIICISDDVFDRGGAKHVSFGTLVGNLEYNAEVVGFSFKNAHYTPNPPYVFKAHAVDKYTNWRIETSFQDLSIAEQTKRDTTLQTRWTKVNVLCLTKDPNIDIKFDQEPIPYGSTGNYWHPIGLYGKDYRCGVFGMSAKEGKLDTSGGYRNLVEARITTWADDVWTVWAGFPATGPADLEKWDIDWFCLNSKYVGMDLTIDCTTGNCVSK